MPRPYLKTSQLESLFKAIIIVSKLKFSGVLYDNNNLHIRIVTAYLTKFFKSRNIDSLFIKSESLGGIGV